MLITTLGLYVHRPESHIGVARIWQGGPIFFQIGKCACRSALLGGFGGMFTKNFFKRCNLVSFGVYLDQVLSLKNYHFLYKNI